MSTTTDTYPSVEEMITRSLRRLDGKRPENEAVWCHSLQAAISLDHPDEIPTDEQLLARLPAELAKAA